MRVKRVPSSTDFRTDIKFVSDDSIISQEREILDNVSKGGWCDLIFSILGHEHFPNLFISTTGNSVDSVTK